MDTREGKIKKEEGEGGGESVRENQTIGDKANRSGLRKS